MRVDKASSVEIDFAPQPEIYATFLVNIDRIGLNSPAFARIDTDTASVLDLELPNNVGAGLQVHAGLDLLGPGGNITDDSTVYRVGIHLRRVGPQKLIDVFVAPRGALFATPAVSGIVKNVGNLRSIRIGSIVGIVRGVFDQLLVDTAAMPPL